MGRNRETQSDSDDVPNTYQLNGVFYYRKRIPTDLGNSGTYGKKEEVKESLKTSDRNEARLQAARLDHYHEEEWAAARRELKKSEESKIVRRTNTRDLTFLSQAERHALILYYFVMRERHARDNDERSRAKKRGGKEMHEHIQELGTDLAYLNNTSSDYEPHNWDKTLSDFLSDRDIAAANTETPVFKEMVDLLKRADSENIRRTMTALGKPALSRDPFFHDYGHAKNSTPPPSLKTDTTRADCNQKSRAESLSDDRDYHSCQTTATPKTTKHPASRLPYQWTHTG
ncbi:MAG: DUF6538 domain-containing protein [Akkermansiaceae bacterium]